jgi:hypothetical protein
VNIRPIIDIMADITGGTIDFFRGYSLKKKRKEYA